MTARYRAALAQRESWRKVDTNCAAGRETTRCGLYPLTSCGHHIADGIPRAYQFLKGDKNHVTDIGNGSPDP